MDNGVKFHDYCDDNGCYCHDVPISTNHFYCLFDVGEKHGYSEDECEETEVKNLKCFFNVTDVSEIFNLNI